MFLCLAFHTLDIGEPTRLQYDCAKHMQHGPNRLVIEAFRGFGKSLIASLYLLWKLLQDKERKVLYTSASAGKASKATTFMLSMLSKMPHLRELLPEIDQRSSSLGFDVAGVMPSQDPSVTALSITANAITGTRSTDICADDVESKKNSMTAGMRERIQDVCRELGGALLRSEDEVPDAKVFYLGTPQLEESLYHELPKRGYRVMIYPITYPTPEEIDLYMGRLAPIILSDLEKDPSLAGQPTEPTRFGSEVILQREAEYGHLGFLLQFKLMPTIGAAERFPLRVPDLIVMDCDAELAPERMVWSNSPELRYDDAELECCGFNRDHFHRPAQILGDWIPYTDSVMAVDISGRGKDELGWCVAKYLNGTVHVLDVGGMLDGTCETTLDQLGRLARRWGVKTMIAEENWGDGMWSKLMRPHLERHHPKCALQEFKTKGQKETRIIGILDPLLASHRLVINRSAILNDTESAKSYTHIDRDASLSYQLIYQLSRITTDRGSLQHDDRLDAVAQAAAYFVDLMDADQERMMQTRRQEEFENRLSDWHDFVSNAPATPTDWYQHDH